MIHFKVFVRPDDTVTITCPVCKKSKDINVSRFRKKNHTLHVTCTCKTRFTVKLDFRRQYRKKVNLPGTYRIVAPPGGGDGWVLIQNISWTGIGFTVSSMSDFKEGQTVELDFQLDDREQTRLIKQLHICSVHNNYIGSEFSDKGLYEKQLGFFLRF